MNQEPEKEVPAVLWKYRKWDIHAKDLIANSEVYYSQRMQLNDPLDCHWIQQVPLDPTDQYEAAKQLCNHHYGTEPMAERIENLTNLLHDIKVLAYVSNQGHVRSVTEFQLGVLCLSEINDDFLMWSHYADHHKGVCVGIRTERLKRRILPCKYTDVAPVIEIWDYVRSGRDTFVEASRCKATHWAYEREWRTIDQPGPKQYPGCIDSVVIGAKVDDAARDEITAAVAEAGYPIKVYKAFFHSSKYRLELCSIDEVASMAREIVSESQRFRRVCELPHFQQRRGRDRNR